MHGRGYVLVVDDDPDARVLLTRWLSQAEIPVLEASSGEEALELAEAHAADLDLVVSDVRMDGIDGFEVVRRLRASPSTAPVPVVMLTGVATRDDDVVRGVENGAVDYLQKPVSPPVLVAKVKSYSARVRRERELHRELDLARRSAVHDALTGLYNRHALEPRLREEAAHAARCGEPFAVVACDLDHFKLLNDTLGHAAGDRALVAFAAAARAVLRGDDAAFRVGGEEFLLVLRQCGADAASAVAQRLRERLRATPLGVGDAAHVVRFSAGVAVAHEEEGFVSEALLERADAALYCAKRAGRDRTHRAE